MFKRFVMFVLLMLVFIVPMNAHEHGELKVVATTTIIADVARNIGGEHVTVTSLIPANADVHAYQLTPADVRAVEEADLLLVNGAGLEMFLNNLIENVNTPYVVVSNGIHMLAFGEAMHDHSMDAAPAMSGHDHSHAEATEPPAMGNMGGHMHDDSMAMGVMTGAFMLIENKTDKDIILKGFSAAGVGTAEVHETVVVNEVASMVHMEDGLVIPANGSVELKPRSYHLMLMDMSVGIEEGQLFPLTVNFDGASDLIITAVGSMMPITTTTVFENEAIRISNAWVRPVAAPASMDDHNHSHSDIEIMEHAHEGANYVGYLGVTTDCGMGEHDHAHEGDAHDHAHGECDPHVWTDPMNVKVWARNIARAFAEKDPAHASVYMANAGAYIEQLSALNEEVKQILSGIPQEKRVLISNHEFLAYFAVHYGFEVAGVVIGGGTTLASPDPQSIAMLAQTMKERGVNVIFAEVSSPTRLAEALAAEVGGDVKVVTLYSGSLSDQPPADTYIGYVRANAQAIATALGN